MIVGSMNFPCILYTWTEYEGGGAEWDNDKADYEVSCRQAHNKHIRHLNYKINLRKKYVFPQRFEPPAVVS